MLEVRIADIADKNIESAVWQILCDCDAEFVPPLSTRDSSMARSFAPVETSYKPSVYFEEMRQQIILTGSSDGEIQGFISFCHELTLPELGECVPANYVTTVCVKREHRRHGVCAAFYDFILNSLPTDLRSSYTATRTWTQNIAHLNLLDKLGFQVVTRLESDRAEGVDTIYLARQTSFE